MLVSFPKFDRKLDDRLVDKLTINHNLSLGLAFTLIDIDVITVEEVLEESNQLLLAHVLCCLLKNTCNHVIAVLG